MSDNQQLWEILVPTMMGEPLTPIRTRYHRVWDAKVREIAGGLTVLKPAKGQWISPEGTLFAERMIPVRIACTLEQMFTIAAMTKTYYKQLKVLFYRVADEVHFV